MNENFLKDIQRTKILCGGNTTLRTHYKLQHTKDEAIRFAVENPIDTMKIVGSIGLILIDATLKKFDQSDTTVPTNNANNSNNLTTENS